MIQQDLRVLRLGGEISVDPLLLLGRNLEREEIDGLVGSLLLDEPGHENLGLCYGVDIAQKDDAVLPHSVLEKSKRLCRRIAEQSQESREDRKQHWRVNA